MAWSNASWIRLVLNAANMDYGGIYICCSWWYGIGSMMILSFIEGSKYVLKTVILYRIDLIRCCHKEGRLYTAAFNAVPAWEPKAKWNFSEAKQAKRWKLKREENGWILNAKRHHGYISSLFAKRLAGNVYIWQIGRKLNRKLNPLYFGAQSNVPLCTILCT